MRFFVNLAKKLDNISTAKRRRGRLCLPTAITHSDIWPYGVLDAKFSESLSFGF